MSFTLTLKLDDLFELSLDGVLTFDDLKAIESNSEDWFRNDQKIKILVLAAEFDGWDKGDWGDLTFMNKHDQQIDKIAVVTKERWHKWMSMFLCPRKRHAEVKIFFEDEEEAARSWLQDQS